MPSIVQAFDLVTVSDLKHEAIHTFTPFAEPRNTSLSMYAEHFTTA